ncbi:HemK2/MTQ2 family protein methyltransferase [Methanobacterium aggregans]|uniref:HemK2/MTQ2 family protein methyltransferase n=1 Tax=Methanobacterium aggregans TaxID=1615586 RepID=UPI001AE7C97D|nr:HemK2/MTQ2 family protein methyltransferase [Methanobacterium aggregans]
MFEYNETYYYIHENVYEPAEDTFLLASNLQTGRKDRVLEIGTGTGLIAITAAKKSMNVVATDINPHAIECASKNIITNRTYNVELRRGDLFEAVEGEKFDLILFNTPYLPTGEDEFIENELNAAWDGGKDGREVIDRFLDDLIEHLNSNGRVQLVQSSLSDNDKTLEKLESMGFEASITAKEHAFFEEIVVITGILK